MSYPATVFKVMIASPDDVKEEREIIREVIHEWNATHSIHNKLVLLPVGWETDSTPGMGKPPQDIINEQILHNSDMLIGVFWARLGTPTQKASSGTVEEINEFVDKDKPAMLYFSKKPFPHDADTEQVEAVRGFEKEVQDKKLGLYCEYKSDEDFRIQLGRHLAQKVISDLLPLCPEQEALEEQLSEKISLSEDAKILLKVTASSQRGEILLLHTSSGTTVQAGDHIFCDGSNNRAAVRWEAALEELNNVGYIKDRKGKGIVFRVTQQGYQASDEISGKMSWSD